VKQELIDSDNDADHSDTGTGMHANRGVLAPQQGTIEMTLDNLFDDSIKQVN
jgi:hypothetical protein